MHVYKHDNRVEPHKFKTKLNKVAKIGDIYQGTAGYYSIKVRGGWEQITRSQIPFYEKQYGKAKVTELFPNLSVKDNVLVRSYKKK